MRTTVNIPDEAFELLKEKAQTKGVSIGDVIGEAAFVAYRVRPAKDVTRTFELPVAGKGGLRPGVDLDSHADLEDVMDRLD